MTLVLLVARHGHKHELTGADQGQEGTGGRTGAAAWDGMWLLAGGG